MSRDQFWFFHPFRVRYSEIDGQGVVFNAHYLTYFDTTITEYFRALGYDQFADAKATGLDFHVVKSLVEYKAPIHFDQGFDLNGAPIANEAMKDGLNDEALEHFAPGGGRIAVFGRRAAHGAAGQDHDGLRLRGAREIQCRRALSQPGKEAGDHRG